VLHKCANPVCPSQFRNLSLGKLFLVETDRWAARTDGAVNGSRRRLCTRQVERYWLCDCCCLVLTLTFERGRGMVTVPLPASNTPSARGASEGDAWAHEPARIGLRGFL
jgi:hypothetical protein